MFKILNTKFVRSAPVVAAIWLSLTAGIIIEFNRSGREYLIESKKTKNPADLEIIIDLDLARKCLVKGAQWPLLANKQGRNGDLREKDNNITLNGPR